MNRFVLALAAILFATSAFAFGFRTGQVSVGTGSASQIGDPTDRISISIFNQDSTNPVYCGNSTSVTSSTGLRIGAGIGFTMDGAPEGFTNAPEARAAIYCISTGGTVTVSFLEGIK